MDRIELLDSGAVTTEAVKPHAFRWGWVLPLAVSVACGFLALSTSDAPMRWFVVYLVGTVGLPVALLLYNAYALQLTAILLSLQAYMCLTLLPGNGTGADARGLEIHLTTLLCVVAVTMRWSEIATRGVRLTGTMVAPFLTVMGTLAFATLLNREHKAGVIMMSAQVQYFLAYLAIMNLVTDQRYARVAIAAILLTVITQSGVYFVEYATHKTFTLMGEVVDHSQDLLQRHGGLVSTHPSGFAEFMNLVTLVSVALYLAAPAAGWRRRAAMAAILGTTAILLTLTRAAWIGFVLGAVMLVATGFRRGWLSTGAVGTMAVAGLVMVVLFIQPITGVFMKQHEEDLDERVVLQEMALMVIESRPILGVGPGAYPMEFRNYAVDRGFNGYWAFTVHNHYMLRAAEAGLPGLIAMLWLFWRAWMLAWGSMRLRSPVTSRLGLGVAAGMVALFFQFYFDIGDGSCVHFALWCLFGLLEALRTLEERGEIVGFEDGVAA